MGGEALAVLLHVAEGQLEGLAGQAPGQLDDLLELPAFPPGVAHPADLDLAAFHVPGAERGPGAARTGPGRPAVEEHRRQDRLPVQTQQRHRGLAPGQEVAVGEMMVVGLQVVERARIIGRLGLGEDRVGVDEGPGRNPRVLLAQGQDARKIQQAVGPGERAIEFLAAQAVDLALQLADVGPAHPGAVCGEQPVHERAGVARVHPPGPRARIVGIGPGRGVLQEQHLAAQARQGREVVEHAPDHAAQGKADEVTGQDHAPGPAHARASSSSRASTSRASKCSRANFNAAADWRPQSARTASMQARAPSASV